MINGLPEWARRYIHDIETYEPSGATSAAALAARYAAGVVHGAEVERRGWRGRAEEAEIGLCAHSQNRVPTDAVFGWLQYIKGTRAAMPARGEEKRPPPPETLVNALQDCIHPTCGKLIRAKKIRAALEKKR